MNACPYVFIFVICVMQGLPSQCLEYASDNIEGIKGTGQFATDVAQNPTVYYDKAGRDLIDFATLPDKSKGAQKEYTWKELQGLDGVDGRHLCLVINCNVYDVTNLADWHPAGPGVLKAYVGRDATEAFRACGMDPKYADTFVHIFLVGWVKPNTDGSCTEAPTGNYKKETGKLY